MKFWNNAQQSAIWKSTSFDRQKPEWKNDYDSKAQVKKRLLDKHRTAAVNTVKTPENDYSES